MNTLEAFEAIRRKHLRQNRDIIKVNSVQALKIKQLETEVGRLTVENLELRSNNIALTEQILRERRLRGQDPNVEATKTTLRNVIKQLTNTLASFGGNEDLRGIDEQLLTMLTPEPEGTKLIPDEPMVKDLASQASASGKPVGKVVQRRTRPQVTKELSSILEAGTEDSEEAETPSPLLSMDIPRIIEPMSTSDVDAPLESPAILSDEQLERLQGDLDMSSNFKRKSNIFAPPQDDEMKEDLSKSTKSNAGRKRKAPNAGTSHGPRRRSGTGGDFNKDEHLLDSKENVDLSVMSVKSAPTSPDSRERRNRKSVNYALPSLRVKMRREDPPMFPVAVGKVPEWSAKDFDKSRKSKGEKRDRSRSQSPSAANEIVTRRESLSAPTTPRPRSLSPPASPTDTPTRGMLIDSDNFERDVTPLQLDRRRKQRRESFQVVSGLGLMDAYEDLDDAVQSDVAPAEGNMYTTT